MLRCPKCASKRIRRGYGQPPLYLRLLGIRELLCNECNLIFRAFVLPGMMPKSSRGKQARRKQKVKSGKTEAGLGHSDGPKIENSSPSARRCPNCNSDKVHRAHRRNMRERLLSKAAIFPYRCGRCSYKFYLRS